MTCKFCGADTYWWGSDAICERCIPRMHTEDKCWKCKKIFQPYVMSHGMCEDCNREAVRNVKSIIYGDPDYNPFMH